MNGNVFHRRIVSESTREEVVDLGSIVQLRYRKPVDPLFWLIWTTAFWLMANDSRNDWHTSVIGHMAEVSAVKFRMP
jgi:hypothetical protein